MRNICLLLLFIVTGAKLVAQEINHTHSVHHAFIENKGQWDDRVLFKSKIPGGNLWIEQGKFMYHLVDYSIMAEAHANPNIEKVTTDLPQVVIHEEFIGANKVFNIDKNFKGSHYYNYYLGNKPERWASDVHSYGEALLHNFYNGIDLKLIEQKFDLKYEFHVDPSVSPDIIKWKYHNADKVSINRNGNLEVKSKLGSIIENKPVAYQIINGRIVDVECAFNIQNDIVGFVLGSYNSDYPLVIDPELIFATYSGSITDNFGMTATYAHDGKAYSGGIVFGNAYPTPDPEAYDTASNFSAPQNSFYGITDVFISKYSEDGTQMLWTTYIGGGNDTIGSETVHSLIADSLNNLYFFGATSSTDFPVVNGYQSTHNGGVSGANFNSNGVYFLNQGTDIYVAKLSSNGHDLLASTYLGGNNNDGVNYTSPGVFDYLTKNYGDYFRGEIMLDSYNNCLIASCTRSNDFPVKNAFQSSFSGLQDAVIFSLNSDLSDLNWSSYYGGTDNDAAYSIKVDSSQNIVVVGGTSSIDLNNLNGLQTNYQGGKTDGFIMKLDPTGSSITNATYWGTTNYDQCHFVEIDRNDNIFVVGQSEGGNLPVINAGFSVPNASQFITKFSPDLLSVENSTLFGNGNFSINISPSAFLVDVCGNIYVSGWGGNIITGPALNGMPVTSDALYPTSPNGYDFYLFVLQRDFSNLLYATYFGEPGFIREHVDGGTSRFDREGVVYQSVCGACGSSVGGAITTQDAWSETDLSSNCNNLVFKFKFDFLPQAVFIPDFPDVCLGDSIRLSNSSTLTDDFLWDFGNGQVDSTIFEPIISYSDTGTYIITLLITDSICLITDTAQFTINVYDSLLLSVAPAIDLCSPVEQTLTANSYGSSDQFQWSSTLLFQDTLNTSLSDSTLLFTAFSDTTLYVRVFNNGCERMDSVSINFIGALFEFGFKDSICSGQQTEIVLTNNNPALTYDFTWAPDSIIVSQPTPTTAIVNPTISQYVYIHASASNGCEIDDSVFIHVGNVPDNSVIASASDYTIPLGGSTTLYGNPPGYQYLWSPGFDLTNPIAQVTDAHPETTTIYNLQVSDGICTKSDTVKINVYEYTCEEPFVFVPSAFTPNGDGENDVLYVRGEVVSVILFRIFDRWGEMIFETTDRGIGWDGTFRGKMMDPDVYDYYLKAECLDGQEEIIKGNVTLMR